MKFTIFTPTYNRQEYLKILYHSLLSQTFKDFEWIIVDDGSTDATEAEVNSFIQENKLKITYHKQINGGKHRAVNKGLDLAKGELFFIVDSDDYLTNDSLEVILRYYEPIKDDPSIIGVTGFRKTPKGKIFGGRFFPTSPIDSNIIERREIYKVPSDMAQIFKTDLFKNFKFPEIEGENFVAESIVWNKMAIDYKMRYFNEAIYIGEYLDGGLTANNIKNRRKNSKYSTRLYAELANNPKVTFKLKCKSIINFWRFSFFNKQGLLKNLFTIKNYPISLFLFPLGYLLFIKDNKSINKK